LKLPARLSFGSYRGAQFSGAIGYIRPVGSSAVTENAEDRPEREHLFDQTNGVAGVASDRDDKSNFSGRVPSKTVTTSERFHSQPERRRLTSRNSKTSRVEASPGTKHGMARLRGSCSWASEF
jgi:hypothetical protein